MISEMSLGEYIKQSKSKQRSKGKTGKTGKSTGPRLKKTSAKKPEAAPKPIKKLLNVTNLPKTVTNSDLSQMFSKIGVLTRCNVLYDALGQSKVG